MDWVVFGLLVGALAAGLAIGARAGRRLAPGDVTAERQRRNRWVLAAFGSFWLASFAVLAFAGIEPFLILNGIVFGGFLLWEWGRALWRGRNAFRQ